MLNRTLVFETSRIDDVASEVAWYSHNGRNTMSIKKPNQQAEANTHNKVARTIIDFMTD